MPLKIFDSSSTHSTIVVEASVSTHELPVQSLLAHVVRSPAPLHSPHVRAARAQLARASQHDSTSPVGFHAWRDPFLPIVVPAVLHAIAPLTRSSTSRWSHVMCHKLGLHSYTVLSHTPWNGLRRVVLMGSCQTVKIQIRFAEVFPG